MRSLSLLLAGTLTAQSITFLVTLVLARVYTPAAFGEYTLFLATFGILSGLGSLSLDKGIVFARGDDRARFLTGAAVLAAAGIGGLWVIGGTAVWASGLLLSRAGEYVHQVLAVGAGVVGFVAYQANVQLRLYFKDPRSVAVSKVTQSISTGAVQLLLRPVVGTVGLTAGYVVGMYAATLGVLKRAGHPLMRLPGRSLVHSWREVHKESTSYLLFVTPATFIDTLSRQLPTYVIGWLFLDEALGQYGMAVRILAAPAAVFGVAIGQWYLQQTAREVAGDRARLRLLTDTWRRLALLGAVPFTAFLIGGEWIFSAAFGEAWRQAGEFAMILAPVLYVKFVSSPTSGIYYQLGLQRLMLAFSLAMAIARPLAMYLGGIEFGIHGGIIAMSLVEGVQVLMYNAIAVQTLRARVRDSA